MKKLLFLIPTLQGGGAEKVLVDLVNNLDASKYDVTVKTFLDGGVFEKRIKPHVKYQSIIKHNNVIIRRLLMYLLTVLIPPRLAYKIIVREKYDIEIAYMHGSTTKILASSTNTNAIKMAAVHTDLSKSSMPLNTYKSYGNCYDSYKIFDRVIFVSKKAKEGFEKVIGHLSTGIVVYNVLDETEIIRLSEQKIDEVSVGRFVFISVGRLISVKGYDRLIEATAKLNMEGYEFEVWILGEGPERKGLEESLRKHKISNVKLLGFKNNPYKYISNANFFLSTSRSEGYSTVVTEALILGIPVLTTLTSGMDEILDKGKYGLIVENSEEGVYSGMKKILNDPIAYKEYTILAKERSSFFSMEQRISDYEKLFDLNKD